MTWVPAEYLKAFQLKITLRNVKPPVWRRILVNGADDLAFLSETILLAMGWENNHLHRFEIAGQAYEDVEIRSGDPFLEDESILDESRTRLASVVKAKSKFRFDYDFGDGWEHDVVVEKILPLEENLPEPRCLDGARACPPEDVGGPWGYEDFLQTLADPKHPEHADRLEWIGGPFDPKAFSVDEVNDLLSQVWPKKVRDAWKKARKAATAPSPAKQAAPKAAKTAAKRPAAGTRPRKPPAR